MTNNTQASPVYFVQLDTLRFLAAFLVVLAHAWEGWLGWYNLPGILTYADGKTFTWIGERINSLVMNFNIGVNMFFLISGFLITYLLLKEKTVSNKINIPAFFMRRILRIWPLYYFIIILIPFLVLWLTRTGVKVPVIEYMPVVFFYQNFHLIGTQTWDFPFAHFWSICVEEHFYLFWPFVVALFPIKKLPYVFGAVIIGSFCFQAYGVSNGWNWYSMYLNSLCRIDVLALGGLAAWIYFHRQYKPVLPNWINFILLTLLIIALSYSNINEFNTIADLLWKKYILLIVLGLLMMRYVFGVHYFSNLSARNPLNYLGRCSFGIYLWSNISLFLIVHKMINYNRYIGYAPWWAYWPIVIAISLIVPILTYEFIEKPFLKIKNKFAIIKTRNDFKS